MADEKSKKDDAKAENPVAELEKSADVKGKAAKPEIKNEKKPAADKKEEKPAAKEEKKQEKTEKKTAAPEPIKIFTIPLRKAFRKRRKQRVSYSVRLVKEFLERHLKSKNIRLGRHLNEKLWERGIEKPPRRVKVGITLSDGQYRAELSGYAYEEFKPVAAKQQEGLAEKLTARLGGKALKKQEEEDLIEGKKEEPKKEKE